VFIIGTYPFLGYISKAVRSRRTSKQGDSHGKFVVEEELKVGL
jgi:hypothetical protein